VSSLKTFAIVSLVNNLSEYLRSVPDVLETLISEKRLLQAAVLLVRSLKLINKQDMLDIGALSDLRTDLASQETV
jgi:exocyst complex component 4